MDEVDALTWWSEVVIPAALGLGTLIVSAVSLTIALGAHRLARRTAEREAQRSEEAERDSRDRLRIDLANDIMVWGMSFFGPTPPTSEERFVSEMSDLHRLRMRVFASREHDCTAVGAALLDISEARRLGRGLTSEQFQALSGLALAEVLAIATVWSHSPERVLATIEIAAENLKGLRGKAIARAAELEAELG